MLTWVQWHVDKAMPAELYSTRETSFPNYHGFLAVAAAEARFFLVSLASFIFLFLKFLGSSCYSLRSQEAHDDLPVALVHRCSRWLHLCEWEREYVQVQ